MRGTRTLIAIDPGITGGIVVRTDWGNHTVDTNTYEMKDYKDFLFLLDLSHDTTGEVHIMVEKQQSSPRQGVGSAFKTGFGFGRILGWFEPYQMNVELVQPKKWMAHLGIKGGMDRKARKQLIADLISDMYPEVPLYGPRGGLKDGISDAMGIMHYFRSLHD